MDEKLLKTFETACKMHKELFSPGFTTRALLITTEGITAVFLPFKDNIEKEFAKTSLKALVLNQPNILGYIFSSDTYITIQNITTGEREVKSGLVNCLFTRNETITRMSIYDENLKFIKDQESDNGGSEWNVWNMQEIDEKTNEEYQKFKQKNPHLYKELKGDK